MTDLENAGNEDPDLGRISPSKILTLAARLAVKARSVCCSIVRSEVGRSVETESKSDEKFTNSRAQKSPVRVVT